MKQIIQALRANDHQCVFLTNQQVNKENNRLSTVVVRSRNYRSEKFAPKEKVISLSLVQMQKKQTNVQIT